MTKINQLYNSLVSVRLAYTEAEIDATEAHEQLTEQSAWVLGLDIESVSLESVASRFTLTPDLYWFIRFIDLKINQENLPKNI